VSRRGPGAPIPPTLVYVAGFAAAWWLDSVRRFPIDGAGASVPQIVLGSIGMAIGVVMFAWGMMTFARARTGIMLQQDASHVVEAGPYKFTRNPMYVGFTAGYFGLALVLNAAWPVVLLPIVLIVLTLAVIWREERYMRTQFGSDYEAYCRRVPRWL
jgi:protein-S-isoprenylcysteine O-methyltransferase Ste14